MPVSDEVLKPPVRLRDEAEMLFAETLTSIEIWFVFPIIDYPIYFLHGLLVNLVL